MKISRIKLNSLVSYETSRAAEAQKIAASLPKKQRIALLKEIDNRLRDIFLLDIDETITVAEEAPQKLSWAINNNLALLRKARA